MYRTAYDFIKDILHDKQLDDYVLALTGKHLTVIDTGVEVSTPSAQIIFAGGYSTRKINSSSEIEFDVAFSLPFWGSEAFTRCIDFIDFVIPIFMGYRDCGNNRVFVLRINPAVQEPQQLNSQIWGIGLSVSLSVLL